MSHKQIIDAFEGKKELYLNHNSNNTLTGKRVWMQSARYLDEDDAETIPALHAIRDNTKLDLIHEKETLDEHFPSMEELQTLNLSEDMIANTNEIENYAKQKLHTINHCCHNL